MKRYALYHNGDFAEAAQAPVAPVVGKRPSSQPVAPVAHYVFDDPSTYGTDLSGNSLDLALGGSGSHGSVGEFGLNWTQGGGTGTRFYLSNSAFQGPDVSAWCYFSVDAGSGIKDIMGAKHIGSGNFLWALSLENGTYRYFHNYSVADFTRVYSGIPFQSGELAWVGFTRSSGLLKLFVNGIAIDSVGTTTPGVATPELFIGATDVGGGSAASYCEAKLFDTALTEAQMQREYETATGVLIG